MDQEKRIQRLKELSEHVGGNATLGKMLGYDSGAYIGQMLSGHRRISEKFIEKVNSVHKIKGWFSPDVEVDSFIEKIRTGGIEVPLLAVAASMGQGENNHTEDAIIGTLTLAPNWVNQNIRPITDDNNLRFLHAYGDSMEPTFKSGDVLLVDSGVHVVEIDGIYVLEAQQRLFVKRVTQDVFGKVTISSDNPNVKTVSVLDGSEQVSILGRVLWVWDGKRV